MRKNIDIEDQIKKYWKIEKINKTFIMSYS